MKRNKAIKYRIYPNLTQMAIIAMIFGCVRKVYNEMLDVQTALYASKKEHLSKYDAFKYMTSVIKKKFDFLKEADSLALMNSVFALNRAYTAFFEKRANYPRFKSKRKSKRTYMTNLVAGNIEITSGGIKLPKLGIVKAKVHRTAPDGWKLKSVTVSMSSAGKYYASVLYEYEEEEKPISVDSSKVIGLDYKSNGLFKDSNGNVAGSPRYYRKYERKLAKAQRRLSKKEGYRKGELVSNNFLKQKEKVCRIYEKISNSRKDFLQKLSTKTANSYDAVVVEDLDMKSMSNKGFHNGKATLDNGYGLFLSMLEYKLKDRGKLLVKVDKWYPSTQTCSACGYILKGEEKISLDRREWICPKCGTYHDRDGNAAVNIRKEGIRILKEMGYIKAAKAA